MNMSEKIKTVDKKVKQNKDQYNLDVQTVGNVSKHEFLTEKDVLQGNDLLHEADTMKRFEYLPLSK